MNGLLMPAIVSSIRSLKDGSVSITFESQELSPSAAGEIFSYRGKLVAMYLSPKETIAQRELDQIDAVDVDLPGKTKSQRVRNVLYRIWELQPEGHKTFDSYYNDKMQKHIEDLKNVLDNLTC
jgi:hypothetical protein